MAITGYITTTALFVKTKKPQQSCLQTTGLKSVKQADLCDIQPSRKCVDAGGGRGSWYQGSSNVEIAICVTLLLKESSNLCRFKERAKERSSGKLIWAVLLARAM